MTEEAAIPLVERLRRLAAGDPDRIVVTALGATVIAAASTQAKLDFAMKRGAADGLLYDMDLQAGDRQKALARKLKELPPNGIDVVLDPVGGPYSEPALRSLAGGGRHLVIGFTAGIPRVPLNLALLKHCHIVGVDWRTFYQDERDANSRNIEALLALWQNHEIEPEVTELYPFEAAPAAITRLESRQTVGKIVVSVGTTPSANIHHYNRTDRYGLRTD
jgi:NADPH:quinone reductase